MECLIGVVGKDFVALASDTLAVRSIVVMKPNQDRSRQLNAHNMILYSGEPGDSVQFVEYIQKNVQLREITHGVEMSTPSCAGFTRRILADNLRKGGFSTNLLVAGHSQEHGPKLYWIDHLASSIDVPFACQGYGSYFCYSTLDRHFRTEMTREEAIILLKKCIFELKTRFMANLSNWQMHIISSEGITHEVGMDSAFAVNNEMPVRN